MYHSLTTGLNLQPVNLVLRPVETVVPENKHAHITGVNHRGSHRVRWELRELDHKLLQVHPLAHFVQELDHLITKVHLLWRRVV